MSSGDEVETLRELKYLAEISFPSSPTEEWERDGRGSQAVNWQKKRVKEELRLKVWGANAVVQRGVNRAEGSGRNDEVPRLPWQQQVVVAMVSSISPAQF